MAIVPLILGYFFWGFDTIGVCPHRRKGIAYKFAGNGRSRATTAWACAVA